MALAVAALMASGAVSAVIALALLGLAGLGSIGVHAIIERRDGGRRFGLAAPLPLFALVFVVILGVRALSLVVGEEGRYFTVTHAGDRTEWKLTSTLHDDRPERTRAAVIDAHPRVRSSIAPTSASAATGRSSWRWRFAARDRVRHIAAIVPDAVATIENGPLKVVPDEPIGGFVSVRPTWPLDANTRVSLYVRVADARGALLSDLRLAGGHGAAALPTGRWTTLRGVGRVPAGGASVELVVVVHDPPAGSTQHLDIDAGALVPGVVTTAALTAFEPATEHKPLASAVPAALTIAFAMLLCVIAGYLLPARRGLVRRRPSLRLVDADSRRGRRLVWLLAGIGVLGWLWEMRGYGSYGSYLDGLGEIGATGNGHWYQHAVATLPTGLAVYLSVRRIADPTRRLRAWEWGVIALGVAIGASYVLKATVAIPLLTVLLALCLRKPVAGLWILVAGAAFALLTPFIYAVRGGDADAGTLLSGGYWSDFLPNLSSRFFHFESLMVTVPLGNTDAPWQPIVDLLTSVVPRQFWAGKPDSTATRFTQEHLLPGLHSPTDIGILSLPGEAQLIGGGVGIVVVGLVVGLLLRVARDLVVVGADDLLTLLLASSLITGLVFLNDGWGMASSVIVVGVAGLGWILLLRPGRSPNPQHDDSAHRPRNADGASETGSPALALARADAAGDRLADPSVRDDDGPPPRSRPALDR